MTIFGIPLSLSSAELVAITLLAGWVSAALAYALPRPTESSSTAYSVFYRLVQFAHANFDQVKAKTPEV